MKEEFTAKMHLELCNDPIEALEIKAAAVYFDVFVDKLKTFNVAIKEYGISSEQYEEHQPYKGLNPIWD